MARYKSRTLTDGELEFMQVLWAKGDAAPEDILKALSERGRVVTGGTVRNILATLIEKGYVKRRKNGKAYYYSAKVAEDQARSSIVQDLLKRAFAGSEAHLVASLLKDRDVRREELNEIKSLIRGLETEDEK